MKFGSYFIVGVLATIVEWVFYWIFDPVLNLNTNVALVLAFVFSTFANWFFGRILTYKNAEKQNIVKELLKIYGTSVIGLLLNIIIMKIALTYVFPNQTDIEKMISKVCATGIVFFWNFAIREFVIYRDKKDDVKEQEKE